MEKNILWIVVGALVLMLIVEIIAFQWKSENQESSDVSLLLVSASEATPLCQAVECGNKEEVIQLLDEGADLEVMNKYGDIALMLAVEKDNLGIACGLLKF